MNFDLNKLSQIKTPFYYYDFDLLEKTLDTINIESKKYGYFVHYAVKANANLPILQKICSKGLGSDCVSGNEIAQSLKAGFKPDDIVYAGVGKSDDEINLGLDNNIFCFNCESVPEMEVINNLAMVKDKIAKIALRINPNVNASTHHYITTGLEENKFGISMWELESVVEKLKYLPNLELIGIHFHIGSQITDLQSFKSLCLRINEIQEWFYARQIIVEHVNVGGGLGINYRDPDGEPMPDFASYFAVFNQLLKLRPKQKLHFELGRAVVAQCGSLISKVLYVKKGAKTNFAIIDAGMTELIRPALYQAYHKIENLSSNQPCSEYDVVGPICESSDCFGKAVKLNDTNRGDIIVIRSAGAYGEIMSFEYNLRTKVKGYYSNNI